jgi:soluble lytic murein transglycosylase-like protein
MLVSSSAAAAVPFQADFQAVAGLRWPDRAAQCKAESGFNPDAVSYIIDRSGRRVPCAHGLAQFTLPSWRNAQDMGWVGRSDRPENPVAAIRANSSYMLWLEARTSGRWDRALGSYNAGLLSVQRALHHADALGLLGDDAWLRALPSITGSANAAQTRGYVARCAQFRIQIRKEAGL